MYKVKPVFSEKIWGGSKLRDFGYNIPSDKTGEAWIISAYEGNSSLLDNGEELRTFYANNRDKFNNYPTDEFPLLAKILDANDNLSIQVHPNDENAKRLENYPFGKTECWYVLDAKEDTQIQVGLNVTSKQEAQELIDSSDWDSLLKFIPIKRGDLFDIKAGTVHAILKDTVIYELQQSSDITYRIYDFDRVDDQGDSRELHIDKSLEVIDYTINSDKVKPATLVEEENISIQSLITNNIYNLEKWNLKGEKILSLNKGEKHFLLLTIIEGSATINGKLLNQYESGIITSDELENIELIGNAEILVGNPN